MTGSDEGRVTRVTACRLQVDPAPWPYATAHAAEIAADWERRRSERAAMFDGVVHVVSRFKIADGVLAAQLTATRFKSFLHWREAGFPEAGVRDGFGAAVVRAADGRVLLGRQRAGNLNGGLAYMPGGFIDAADVAADGSVDIEASIVRELGEETGLSAAAGVRLPGFLVCERGLQLAIAVAWRFADSGDELRARVLDHLARETAGELMDVVMVGPGDDLAGLGVPAYARLLLRHVFAAG